MRVLLSFTGHLQVSSCRFLVLASTLIQLIHSANCGSNGFAKTRYPTAIELHAHSLSPTRSAFAGPAWVEDRSSDLPRLNRRVPPLVDSHISLRLYRLTLFPTTSRSPTLSTLFRFFHSVKVRQWRSASRVRLSLLRVFSLLSLVVWPGSLLRPW